jgi:trehalose-phosphatase
MAHAAAEPQTGPMLDLAAFDAAIFDLDGVVTKTASIHAAAWKELFDAFLRERAERTGEPFRRFELEDYRRHVDGRPRYDGVQTFLASRGIELPWGNPDDPPEAETVCGLGNRKNLLFNERLRREGAEVFEPAVALLQSARRQGLGTALVSSSKNTAAVLDATGLAGLFDIVVDGNDAARLGLKGKPAPDTYLHAAKLLGVAPKRVLAAEDALAGVESQKAAGFGLVIGIDHGGMGEALRRHGADLVIAGFDELRLASPGPHASTDSALPDALAQYDAITCRLGGKRLALFLDYDGTLTPIVDRPELAVLSDEMRNITAELSRVIPVVIVSGRDRADVARLVGLEGLVYAGSHGFDITGPEGLAREHPEAGSYLEPLESATAELERGLAGIDGALVERKRFATAIHYRLVAPADIAKVEATVDEVLAQHRRLRKTGGKKIFELRPRIEWDKGRAVLWLLEALDLDRPDIVPVYIGDDETDEDAFRALAGRGLGILVADEPRPTHATFVLRDVAAVEAFLRRLLQSLREGGGR